MTPSIPHSVTGHGSPSSLYRAYEDWKGWDHPFSYTADEAAYFSGECRGLAIANADLFEIGFGSGSFLAWASRQGSRVVGSEINGTALAAAKERGIELMPAAFEEVAGDYALRFDTVVAFDVFEHFTLDEIVRRLNAVEHMLKPGGKLLMRFPNAQSPFGLSPQHGDPTHKSFLSRSVIELLIQQCNFEVVRYSASYRILGGGLLRRLLRAVRYVLRDVVGGLLDFIFATKMPYDPVVVIVLGKRVSNERPTPE